MSNTVLNQLIVALNDPCKDVQISAIYALGEYGEPSALVISKLIALSNEPCNEVKSAAIKALGRIHRINR